jgi:hypothetical protein
MEEAKETIAPAAPNAGENAHWTPETGMKCQPFISIYTHY